MGQIYKSCTLCIAATSAEDCEGGLFFDRDVYLLQPIQILVRWPTGAYSAPLNWYNCFVQAPYNNNIMSSHLNTRSWVVQERSLPTRILHCSKKELVWECNEKIATETFPDGILAGWDHHPSDRIFHLLEDPSELVSRGNAHDRWLRIVTHYSACNLSRDSDILIALSGLAQECQSVFQDDYLAGLWKGYLNVGLLWYTTYGHDMDEISQVPERPAIWRAPTWSWASIKGQVQYSRELDLQVFTQGYERERFPLADIVDWEVVNKSTSKTCQLLSASIILRGTLIHATVDYTDTWLPEQFMAFKSEHGLSTRRINLDLGGTLFFGQVHFDFPDMLYELAQMSDSKILCLPLLMLHLTPRDSSGNQTTTDFTVEGIVLDVSEDPKHVTYERIGHFRTSSSRSMFGEQKWRSKEPWNDFAKLLALQDSIDLTLI